MTMPEFVVCAVGLVVLCIVVSLPEWRRKLNEWRRKQRERRERRLMWSEAMMTQVIASMAVREPLCQIEKNLDQQQITMEYWHESAR